MWGKVSAGLLVLVSLQGCADDGPLSPSSELTAGSATNLPPASGTALRARVVNAVTGSPVGGASITVEGEGSITADSDGVFRLDRAGVGTVRVVVEASGYWPRETGMRPASPSLPLATLSLMPDGDDFDLAFYDHVFRNVGEDGTHPWTTEPRFEIWEGRYECTAFVESEACDELTALDELAPAAFFDTVRGVIGSDARRYTDGQVLGSSITTRSHPAGTVLRRSQYIEPGKVSIAYVSTRDNFSWTLWRYN
ncbi:MAG TPA: carboxypeptidase-like regulatory domain-containing protein, partial [Vicinamibacteria bacterium]|nr:carboxypeptidase-like regulatory domain-containing protein [Vicinamibacteria bacterium]